MILDALTVGPASPPVERLADSSRSLVCEIFSCETEIGRFGETETDREKETEYIVGHRGGSKRVVTWMVVGWCATACWEREREAEKGRDRERERALLAGNDSEVVVEGMVAVVVVGWCAVTC